MRGFRFGLKCLSGTQGFFCAYLDVDDGGVIHGSISTVIAEVLAARVGDGVSVRLVVHPVARVHCSTAIQLHE